MPNKQNMNTVTYTGEASANKTHTAGGNSEAKILMAEDNLVNQKLATLLFKKINQTVDIVSNGLEAVEAALQNHYDLIFMDIQMPLLDGVEASQRIKEEMGDKAPAIVALTANAMQGDRERYLEAGMDHYIPKPISIPDLEKCIRDYVFS